MARKATKSKGKAKGRVVAAKKKGAGKAKKSAKAA